MEENEQKISSALIKIMGYEEKEELKDCCINILTEFSQYNLCFIDFETENHLGVWVTHEDMTERFVLIEKKYIVSVSIVYEQDIVLEENNEDVCYL